MKHLAVSLLSFLLASSAHGAERWAAYYTEGLPVQAFTPYSLLVFDADRHPPLGPLKSRGKVVLGYLSLAEAAPYRLYFPRLRQSGWLLHELPQAKEHFAIDLRKPEWAAFVIEALIPALIRAGFDGVMLDTADTAGQLETTQPRRFAGMQEAAASLIKTIRLHYPELKIMLNRGFDLLPRVAADIDMVLAESIYTTLDAQTRAFVRQPEAHYRSVSEMLNGLRGRHPALGIYTLDYWPSGDKEGVRAIYAAQRKNGFVPYVSGIDLQQLPEEPE